jgi:uncharacterized protein YceK
MKKISFIVMVLFMASLLAGCGGVTISLGGNQDSTSQTYPLKAIIDSPISGSNLAMGAVDIVYHASAQDGVAAVELSVDGQVVSNLATPDSKQPLVSLKYTWQPTVSGTHILRVRTQSSKGEWSGYAETMVTLQGESQQTQQPQQPQVPKQGESPTDTPGPTDTPEGVQITDIQKSVNKFFFGANSCGPVKMILDIKVSQPKDVFQVVVFNRLWDREGGGSAGFDSGYAMKSLGDGDYTFTYTELNVRNPRGYELTEFHYQFVVMGKNGVKLFKSEVFKDILFDRCF